MGILTDVKTALLITHSYLDSEVTDLINACKADLGISGVLDDAIIETDALIKQAIKTYAKANFGIDNKDSEKFQNIYNSIKFQLTQSLDYAYFSVTFTVVDELDEPIRNATVTFNDVEKTTSSEGIAIFYVRSGNNYTYSVYADEYSSDDDEDNLLDVSESTTVDIILTGA